ncbi:MAG: 50S ribosomal protein L24 [bacterium]
MKVRVGDDVLVIAGKDKGKEGKVIKTMKSIDKVVVEGVNVLKKHQKPTRTNESGSIISFEAPIHVSNVKVIGEKKENKKKASK